MMMGPDDVVMFFFSFSFSGGRGALAVSCGEKRKGLPSR